MSIVCVCASLLLLDAVKLKAINAMYVSDVCDARDENGIVATGDFLPKIVCALQLSRFGCHYGPLKKLFK